MIYCSVIEVWLKCDTTDHIYTGTISQTTVYISGWQCLHGGAYLCHMYYEERMH